MLAEIKELIEDPIAISSFYIEMRLANDPDMTKHAEDFNTMVVDMVQKIN